MGYRGRVGEPAIPSFKELEEKLEEINKVFTKKYWLMKNEMFRQTHVDLMERSWEDNSDKKIAGRLRKENMLQFINGLKYGLQSGIS